MLSLGLCLAMLSPLHPALRGVQGDSFPFSWFGMFSHPRADVERPNYVVGVTADGTRHKISTSYWTTGGFNQGYGQLRSALAKGRAESDRFCQRLAVRMAGASRGWASEVVEVRIYQGTYSRDRYFGEGDHTPTAETLRVKCPVPERTP